MIELRFSKTIAVIDNNIHKIVTFNVYTTLNVPFVKTFLLDQTCGYEGSNVYTGKEYATTRELSCNTRLRNNVDKSIRITSEEWAAHPVNPETLTVPVINLYECGMDAECVNNKCTLLQNNNGVVECR